MRVNEGRDYCHGTLHHADSLWYGMVIIAAVLNLLYNYKRKQGTRPPHLLCLPALYDHLPALPAV